MAGSDERRILIVDGAEIVRRGIRDVLASDQRYAVVGELSRAEDVVEAAMELAPHVVFLGLGRDGGEQSDRTASLAALRRLLRAEPFARVIVLVDGDREEDVLDPVRAGARGILLRDAPAGTLLQAASDVLAGGAALDPRLTRSLFEHLAGSLLLAGSDRQRHELEPSVLAALSPREREVLHALAQGYRNKEIAAQLGVSVGTVKTHLRHIFRKLTVADRTAAVLTALQVRLPKAA